MKTLLNHLVFKSIGYSLFLLSASVFAQTGPGGVGATDGTTTLRAWWRSDTGITLTGGAISIWADLSGYNNHLSQSTAENRPSTAISTALNNRTVVRYAGSHFFTSSFSGPGVDNFTLLLVANGTAYQSLMRFQNMNGTYVVYPYSTAPNTFIISTDGGSGDGISAGLVNGVNNIGAVRYRRNVTTSGMQSFRNAGLVAQRTSADNTLPSQPFFSGALTLSQGLDYSIADVGEMIVFYSALNDAQMVIVQNYLAAKYNVALATDADVYTMDDPANGDYDTDVAGIGQTNPTNSHSDAQGTGLVRILNPQGLNNDEFFMWGHNNQPTAASETKDIPSGLDGRMARVWRVSEVNTAGTAVDVGALDVRFDLTGMGAVNENHLRLLVDTDNDGVFSDETPISGASSLGNNIYQFAAVTRMTNATRFTLATASHATPLNGLRTFYSLATGDWESSTSWSRTSDGSSGALNNGEFPLRTDNVVIRTGHTITINNVSDNGSAGVKPDDLGQANIGPFTASNLVMFYQTGDIFIDGTLNIVDIEIMLGGYTEVLSGALTAGSNLINTGYLEAFTGATLSTLDDLVLTGNSNTIINTNATSTDDLIIDNTDAVLCGTGSATLQNGGGSRITFTNNATIDQVCTTFSVECTGAAGGGCVRSFPTIGTRITIAGGNGPAGVGITNGTSNLVLWLDAAQIGVNNNTTVTTWNDLSGYRHHFTEGNGATYKSNNVNGYGTLEFNGTSNYFQRGFTAALNPESYSIFTASNVSSNSGFKALLSSRNGSPEKGYTVYYTSFWSVWSGNENTWNQLIAGSSTNSWAGLNFGFDSSVKFAFLSRNNKTEDTRTVNLSPNTTWNTRIGAGQNESNPNYYFNGRIGEVIIYKTTANVAQTTILNNYLAAKYNFTLAANDVYSMDNTITNYDHEVAGIGQATDGSYHRDARGGGVMRMWNPRSLGNNEYLIWGHNNAVLNSTTNAPDQVDGILIREKLIREWAVSETGDAGAVNISFDLTEFSGFLGSSLYLLIDRDGDGYKDNDVAPQAGSYSGKKVTFSRVNFQNGDRFTLGNSSVDQPLPVTLVSFTATPQPSSVVLSWKTASEVNNNYFDVQRSPTAEAWETLTRVPGAGNSTQEKVYLYRDEAPLQGKSYYRLKQTDYDGKFTYSRLVLVEYTYALALQPFPNPSTGVFTLKDENLTQEQIELVNMFGNKVPFRLISNNDTQIDISDQPAGVYVIRVFSQNVLQSIKVIKR